MLLSTKTFRTNYMLSVTWLLVRKLQCYRKGYFKENATMREIKIIREYLRILRMLFFSIQFQSGFLVPEGGRRRIHLIPSAIALTPSLHLVRSLASLIFNQTSFTLSPTCLIHVSFDRPRFRSPFTSIIIAFFTVA